VSDRGQRSVNELTPEEFRVVRLKIKLKTKLNIQNEELTRYRPFLYTIEGGYVKESYPKCCATHQSVLSRR